VGAVKYEGYFFVIARPDVSQGAAISERLPSGFIPPTADSMLEAPSKEQPEQAFERLARELDTLWSKPSLTAQEQKRVELILNNAAIAQEIMEGKIPPELEDVA
jgi:hypothetical protein